jgi:peptidyl-prolyl cis-trans isomerase A (cyclophilin A)
MALIEPNRSEGPEMTEETDQLHAVVQTALGRIVFRLLTEEAPRTVAHLVGLATGSLSWSHPRTGQLQRGRPLYDGTTFHRAVPSGFVQFGDPWTLPDGDPAHAGTGGPGFQIPDEIHARRRFDRPGLVGIAHAGSLNSGGSQLFIAEVALPHLQGHHTVVGDVVHGFERVPKIARRVFAGERIVVDQLTIIHGSRF